MSHPVWCVRHLCTAGVYRGVHRGRDHQFGQMHAHLVVETVDGEPGVLLSRAGLEVTVSVPEFQALWVLGDDLLDELDGTAVPVDRVYDAG